MSAGSLTESNTATRDGATALTDWPIFYLVPALSGHYLLTHPRRGFVSLAPFLAAASGLASSSLSSLAWLMKTSKCSSLFVVLGRLIVVSEID